MTPAFLRGKACAFRLCLTAVFTVVVFSSCGRATQDSSQPVRSPESIDPAREIRVGEALVGDGNEIAQVYVTIGSKDGPVGAAFVNVLARQSEGHSSQLVVLEGNVAVKPSTVLVNMVTIKEMKPAVQIFGPVRDAVAQAVTDSVVAGIIDKAECESLVIFCNVFLHPSAEDNDKIHQYKYKAAMLAIERAIAGQPGIDEIIEIRKIQEPEDWRNN